RMNYGRCILLFVFLISLPSFAQKPLLSDSIRPLSETTVINDIGSLPNAQLIPDQGFSFDSLGRGIIGMLALIGISFLFSANRKAINWKTVGIGLSIQILLAIGILKVRFIQMGFTEIGKVFVNILDYTLAGSKFLLGNLLDLDNPNIGYIFAFQILPTIIFFSALTSVLFYLGIIQKVVKGLAWLLTKSLGISGAESLSVAGNIFLGQTEAPLLIK